MHQPTGFSLQCPSIYPVAGTDGRIETFDTQRIVTAAKQRLLYTANLLFPCKLVQLLKPYDTHIAKWQLDAFQLACIVQTEEKDFLSGFDACNLHWADGGSKSIVFSKCTDRPAQLRKDTGA